MRCAGFLALPLLLTGTPVRAEDAPDPSELLSQSVRNFAEFSTELLTRFRKAELARYLPPGRQMRVSIVYRVVKPAPAEEMEVRVFDRIDPFEVRYLREPGVEYRQEEAVIVGTGEQLKKGAPACPSLSPDQPGALIEWERWKRRSEAWVEERRTSRPPDRYQVHGRGTAVNRAGLEKDDDPDGQSYAHTVTDCHTHFHPDSFTGPDGHRCLSVLRASDGDRRHRITAVPSVIAVLYAIAPDALGNKNSSKRVHG